MSTLTPFSPFLLSLIGTAKRQGKDPMDLIKNLLLDGKNASPETLYEIENFRTFDTSQIHPDSAKLLSWSGLKDKELLPLIRTESS